MAVGHSLVMMLIALPSYFLGMALGYFGSGILISANEHTYSVDNLVKGITSASLVKGTLVQILVVGLVTYLAFISFKKVDVALLMKRGDSKKVRPGIIEKLIDKLRIKDGYCYKLTFKNGSELLLLLVAVATFSIMFALSMSLLASSKIILESQNQGRTYQYETVLDDYMVQKQDTDYGKYLLREDIKLFSRDETINYNLVGISDNNNGFSLLDKHGQNLDIAIDGVVINPELVENYGIKIGDQIDVDIDGNIYPTKVEAVAANAGLKTIYINKAQMAEWLNINQGSYNMVLSQNPINENNVALKNQILEVEHNQTSNKASAIINQSIGVLTGCLLIFLAVFIGLTGNTESILVFNLLGYDNKRINKILLNPYMVFANVIFIVTLPICIFVARKIQTATSLATGDYMPFSCNILAVLYMVLILNLICLLVREIFTFKIKKTVKNESQFELLYEL